MIFYAFEEMSVKKILLLEDNKTTLEYMKKVVQEVPIKSNVYSCDNIKDAYKSALEKTIDLFIVDIILDVSNPGDSSGLKFVDSIRQIERYNFIPVIFVTSLEDARLYTYEKLHCYSFVEKPFDAKRLKELVVQCLNFPGSRKEEKTLYFRKDGIILAVDRDDIVYAESINHIMHIYTANKDQMSIPYITLKKLIEEADSPNMIQCNRSTVVNKAYIHNIDFPNRMIQLKNNLGRVEIGIMYKKYLREKFQ